MVEAAQQIGTTPTDKASGSTADGTAGGSADRVADPEAGSYEAFMATFGRVARQ